MSYRILLMHAWLVLLRAANGQEMPYQQPQDAGISDGLVGMQNEALGLLQVKAKASDTTKADNEVPAILAIGTHHKTGTHLSQCILDSCNLGEHGKIGRRYRSDFGWQAKEWEEHPARRWLRFYKSIDKESYDHLKEEGKYRVVHITRDPLAIIISGYCYHTWSNDTGVVGRPDCPPDQWPCERTTGPEFLKKLSVEEGLVLEAGLVLNSTLMEMTELMKATRGDKDVATVSLEDFTENFNETVAKMFDFMFGRDHPKLEDLVQNAT